MAPTRAQFKVRYYIPKEFSDEVVKKMKAKLKNLNRRQLELLVCVLTREIVRLECISQSCSQNPKSCPRYHGKDSENTLLTDVTDHRSERMLRSSTLAKGKRIRTLNVTEKSDSDLSGKMEQITHLKKDNTRKEIITVEELSSSFVHSSKIVHVTADSTKDHIRLQTFQKSDGGESAKEYNEENTVERSRHIENHSGGLLFERSLAEEGLVVDEDKKQRKLHVFNLYSGQMVYVKPGLQSTEEMKPLQHELEIGNNAENDESLDEKSLIAASAQLMNTESSQLSLAESSWKETSSWPGTACDILKNVLSTETNSVSTITSSSTKKADHTSERLLTQRQSINLSSVKGKVKFSHPLDKINQQNPNAHQCAAYSCMMCGGSFKHKHNLNFHVKSNHIEKTILCSYCGKLVLYTRLKTHLKKVHEKPSYTCPICHKGFLKKECLEGHMNKHNNSKPYICQFCGRKYAYSTSLSSHKKLCSKATVPSHLLQPHNLEEKDTTHICEICGMKFEGTSGLKDHYNAKHGTRILNCAFCGKGFQWRPSYTRHVKKCRDRTDAERAKCKRLQNPHSTGKQYICICGKQYHYRQSYQRHQKMCKEKQNVQSYVTSSTTMEIPFSDFLGSNLVLNLPS